jgi:predicted AAA+ superfamily ATPase
MGKKIYTRSVEESLKKNLFKGNIIVLYGPRQSGKTTLSKQLIKEYGDNGEYFDCQEESVRRAFVVGEPDLLYGLVKNKKIVILDEAQTILNIGTILKVFHDKYKHLGIQIVATGSSSFDLANKIVEPMTGRAVELMLPPLSLKELRNNNKVIEEKDLLDILLYGSYPEVVFSVTYEDKQLSLKKIATNYLYKDIFILESIKRPKAFEDILRMLALQIGQCVSTAEIARAAGVNRSTVDRYLILLEQSFIIKRVYSFSRNLRNEIKKSYKVYFLDIGIRNAIVDILSPVKERRDRGAIFENFIFTEIWKEESLKIFPAEIFFWRTKQGLEIDFIKKEGASLYAYECKFGGDTKYSFGTFLKEYKENVVAVRIVSFVDILENIEIWSKK